MSVLVELESRRRAFPGYDDPRYPLYIWAGQAVVAGDASGGNRVASIILASSSGPKVSLLWSLEQLSILDSQNTSQDMDLTLTGLDELLGTQVMRLQVSQGITTASLRPADYPRLPFYMGAHAAQSVAAAITLTAANAAATVLVFAAQGYAWGSRSRSIPGGPQRPPTGLFRA